MGVGGAGERVTVSREGRRRSEPGVGWLEGKQEGRQGHRKRTCRRSRLCCTSSTTTAHSWQPATHRHRGEVQESLLAVDNSISGGHLQQREGKGQPKDRMSAMCCAAEEGQAPLQMWQPPATGTSRAPPTNTVLSNSIPPHLHKLHVGGVVLKVGAPVVNLHAGDHRVVGLVGVDSLGDEVLQVV